MFAGRDVAKLTAQGNIAGLLYIIQWFCPHGILSMLTNGNVQMQYHFETSQKFIHAFCLSKIHFYKTRLFIIKLDRNHAQIFLRFVRFISSMELLIEW